MQEFSDLGWSQRYQACLLLRHGTAYLYTYSLAVHILMMSLTASISVEGVVISAQKSANNEVVTT
jgi:hypothetical protein